MFRKKTFLKNMIFSHSLKSKIVKEISWSFATKGITFALFILLNVAIARMLGVEKFGTWSFFFSIISVIFLISNFGINNSTRAYIVQYRATDMLRSIIRDSFKLRLLFSFIFASLIFIFAEHLSVLINHPEFEILFKYSAPFVFLMGLTEYLKSVFMGLHRIKYNFIINTLEHGLKIIFFAITLLCFSITLPNIVNIFNLALFLTVLIGLSLLYFVFFVKLKKSTSKIFTSDIFKYSIPLFFTGIGAIVATEIDIIMLSFLSSNYEVGIYTVAKGIITKLPHISMAIAMGAMPIFIKVNKENKDRLKALFLKLLRINAKILMIIVPGVLLFSSFLIPLLYGIEYSGSVFPLQILTIFLINRSFLVFLTLFLDYQGLAKKRLFNSLIAMTLNIFLNFLLIPKYGATGAAIATSVAYIPYVLLNWLEIQKVFKTKY